MTPKAADIEVAEVKCTPESLTISWQNSTYSVYSSLWLRDNAAAHRDACTGQRLISLVDLPLEPRLKTAHLSPPDHISLSWDDGETAVYPLQWMRAYDVSLRLSARPTRLPWMGQPATQFAWSVYSDWVADPSVREDWLYYAGRDGLAFLSAVPAEDAAVLKVAAQIGFVRETNFGRIFDDRSVTALPAHTDDPYRDPVPGFELLHCLSAADHDGESIFVDGMAAAERVRARDANAFSTLCKTRILYRFQDATTDLAVERTMFEVDTSEQFRAICYNERLIAPLPIKGPLLKKYYAAYRQLAGLLSDPARFVVYRLQPGDLVLFDNSRILHGRVEGKGGSSHQQGCYLDADGLYSSLAVLAARRTSSLPIQSDRT
jgi:alpha-ketoglutarate-dependent taurine dioxygenase